MAHYLAGIGSFWLILCKLQSEHELF